MFKNLLHLKFQVDWPSDMNVQTMASDNEAPLIIFCSTRVELIVQWAVILSNHQWFGKIDVLIIK